MIKRKMIIIILLISLSLIISGCVMDSGELRSFISINCFYKIVDDKLVGNSVAFGVGNNQKLYKRFFPTYESIGMTLWEDITIEVFVDDVLVEIVSLPKEEFYTEKYDVNPGVYPELKQYYKKVVEFNVANYDVKEKIKFVLTIINISKGNIDFYNGNDPFSEKHPYPREDLPIVRRGIELYGNFVDGIFVVSNTKKVI